MRTDISTSSGWEAPAEGVDEPSGLVAIMSWERDP